MCQEFVARDSDISDLVMRARCADGRWQIAVNTMMLSIRSQRLNAAVTLLDSLSVEVLARRDREVKGVSK